MNDKIKMGQLPEIHRQTWKKVAQFCAVMQKKDRYSAILKQNMHYCY